MTTQKSPPANPHALTKEAKEALHKATREQLASFKSHKVVKAAKITRIDFGYSAALDRTATLLIPEDEKLYPIEVSKEFMGKHSPEAPGYFVVYPDGYESWSPVESFESGYTQEGAGEAQDIQKLLAEGLAYRETIDNGDRHVDEETQAAIDGERGG